MRPQVFTTLVTISRFLAAVQSYGTTVQVYPATCPALENEQVSPPTSYLLAVSPGPITILPRAIAPTYIKANGATTDDCSAAATYTLENGQLSANGQFVSATGLEPYSPLAVSSVLGSISRTFSTANGTFLSWRSTGFVDGQAMFCALGAEIETVYNGQLPMDCAQVKISLVPATSCPNSRPSGSLGQFSMTSTVMATAVPSPSASGPQIVNGRNVTAYPFGCLISSTSSPAVSPIIAPILVSTLVQCVDLCSSNDFIGVQTGVCVCGDSLNPMATPAPYGSCNSACTEGSAQNCGGATAMVVYRIGPSTGGGLNTSATTSSSDATHSASTTTDILFSSGNVSSTATSTTSSGSAYVTSSGVPNCFARSSFDYTVNNGYLILCNTALVGSDIMSTNGANLVECIEACDTFNLGPNDASCVAVAFDKTTTTDQCTLKSSIGPVRTGADDTSNAAIFVPGDTVPAIDFVTASPTMDSTSTLRSTSSTSSTMTSEPQMSSVETTFGPVSSIAIQTPEDQSSQPASSSEFTDTAATSLETSTQPSSTTSTVSMPVPSVASPGEGEELCPQYNGQTIMLNENFYHVQCATEILGEVLVAQTETAGSLAECGAFCNLYNLAVPYGCVGVTLLSPSNAGNCMLLRTTTGRRFNLQDDSLRLLYPGYPSPSDPVLTESTTDATAATPTQESVLASTPASSSISSSSSSSTSASSIRPLVTDDAPTSSPSSTPPASTANFCPARDGEVVSFPSYGDSNYEIACSTSFNDGGLNSIFASRLTECVDQCSFLNLNSDQDTPRCVGVSYTNTPEPGAQDNCFLQSTITSISSNVIEYDSARLIYSGYSGRSR